MTETIPFPPSPASKTCHRFMIPIPIVDQSQPLKGGDVKIVNHSQMAFVQCIGNKCALWSAKHKECGDLVRAEAIAEIARVQVDRSNSINVE